MEQQKGNQFQQDVEDIIGTTVWIEKEYEANNSTGEGSGVFIEPDKIVTNIHVLSNGKIVNVKMVGPNYKL